MQAYRAAGLHLFTSLPFRPGRGGLGDILLTHFFVNSGIIDNFNFCTCDSIIEVNNIIIVSFLSPKMVTYRRPLCF